MLKFNFKPTATMEMRKKIVNVLKLVMSVGIQRDFSAITIEVDNQKTITRVIELSKGLLQLETYGVKR